jgi:hypothetical protein
LATIGPKLIDVLVHVWSGHVYTKSRFCREQADLVAEAASRGLITTLEPDGPFYGRFWRITPAGCSYIFKLNREHHHDNPAY